MFNRVLQVRMVKTHTQEPTGDTSENRSDDPMLITAVVAEAMIKKVAVSVLAYVALDTVRQVLVARAQKT